MRARATWTSPYRSRTPASASPRTRCRPCSRSSSRPMRPCAAGRAERGWASPSPAGWRGRWAARSWSRARRARGSTFTATMRLKRVDGPAGRQSCGRGAGRRPQHVLLALESGIERRALRLSLEGAGIPLEECALARASAMAAAASEAGRALHDPDRRRSQRLRAGGPAPRRRQGRGAGQRAGRHRAGYRGKGGLRPISAKLASMPICVRPVRPRSVLTRLGLGPEPIEAPLAGRSNRGSCGSSLAPSVLLVEDNDINALLARRMLEKVGCKVQPLRQRPRGGRGDPARARRPRPPLRHRPDGRAHAGARRPGGDPRHQGALRRAGRRRQPPPIVAVTANAFDEDRRRCLEAGMDDYLAKPFDREELHRLLETWCSALVASGRQADSRSGEVIAGFNAAPAEPCCRSSRRAVSRT